jgi:hypothetical protein
MKKTLISFICGGLTLTLSISHSIAQQESFKELSPITISATSSGTVVNAKINKAFGQFFKDATHLRWYEIDKKFIVKFIMNDQENRALFTKAGELVYHISYGTEAHLPADVRKLIKSNYYDQKITRVLKVIQDERTIWVVSMEDDKEYVMARVEDNEVEETHRMLKTK